MKKSLIFALLIILVSSGVCLAKVIKQHYPNGQLKSVTRYNDKKQLNGPYKLYWPNGQLKEQGKYKNGFHVGQIKRYSIDGVLLGQQS